ETCPLLERQIGAIHPFPLLPTEALLADSQQKLPELRTGPCVEVLFLKLLEDRIKVGRVRQGVIGQLAFLQGLDSPRSVIWSILFGSHCGCRRPISNSLLSLKFLLYSLK